ncbi:MAG TPA: SDR family oxidoreductase [Dehalococcoidia bacterium]|nr:SDR family oxidoreductase [Dehalococcoidia bacterium]
MSLSVFDITGQKVLLVGAGRGIGKGIALAFAEAGADVAISALTPNGVNKVAEEIKAMGRTALPLTGDATKAADMDRIAQQAVAQLGQVDVLVNCVGDSIRKPVVKLPGSNVEGMTEDEWRFIVDINLTEAFQGCRALGPHLLERRQGCVINISGWASFRGRPESAAYDAAKAGVMRFTECLAQEWAPYGVRVNAIAPGSFPDPEQMSAEAYRARDEAAKGQIPLGRVGRLKEIGYLAVFLASPAAGYVTGQTWAVDGGVSIKHP